MAREKAGRLAAVQVENLLRSFRNCWNMVHLKDGMLHLAGEVQTSNFSNRHENLHSNSRT
jgi:hypothetical protein